MNDNPIIGIDLGTTNSLIATVDVGIPMVLADLDGHRLTPSVVHFPSNPDSPPVTGRNARRVAHLHPDSTFASIKRFMGRRSNEIPEAEIVSSSIPMILSGAQPVKFETPSGPKLPEEISAIVLRHLVDIAESRLEKSISRAVITVPAYFNDAQRQATQRAGEIAGLTVERIINEPTAAALAYGIDKSHTNARIAVFDLGGGTFDISILHLNDGVFQVLSTSGDTHLGGDDIDMALSAWIQGRILEQAPAFHPGLEHLSIIRAAAEEAKIRLSSDLTATVRLPFLTPTNSFEFEISRQELDEIASPIIGKTRTHCLRALKDANLEPTDLDQVILVGGQSRMPLVRQFVHSLFQCSDFEESKGSLRVGLDPHRPDGPRLNISTNPDEAVALGAAIQGAILSGALKNVILMDVTPLSLGIETFGGLMNVIIPRNTTIPVKAGEMFTNAMDYQKGMLIRVLQGERELAKDNWELGQFEIDFPPLPRATARVGVQFEIDSNGILHVLARDTSTGLDTTIRIQSAVDVDDSKVQEMVEASVEHAFSDLAQRRWIETVATANQTVEAIQQALNNFSSQLDQQELDNITLALDQVTTLISKPLDDVSTEDPTSLKQSLKNLDEIATPLTDAMMEAISIEFLKSKGLID